MKHSEICAVAIDAALDAQWLAAGRNDAMADVPRDAFYALYTYARERRAKDRHGQFPSVETLFRKMAELLPPPAPHLALAARPQDDRAFFAVFRAVIEALEPFHEDDLPMTATEVGERQASHTAAIQTAGALPAPPDFQEIAICFARTGSGNPPDLQFVEIEDVNGYSIAAGTWLDDAEFGMPALRLTVHISDIRTIAGPPPAPQEEPKQKRGKRKS